MTPSPVEVVPYLVDVGTDGLVLVESQLIVLRRRTEAGVAAGVILAALAHAQPVDPAEAANGALAPADAPPDPSPTPAVSASIGDTFALLIRREGAGVAFAEATVREFAPLNSTWHEIVFGFTPTEAATLRAALNVPDEEP